MRIQAIKTRVLLPPQDDLLSAIRESLTHFGDGDVLAVTSKALSISQGRCRISQHLGDRTEKDELVKQEADKYIDRNSVPGGYAILTIKDNILIPSAGVDESNANGYFILWPEKPQAAAQEIHDFLLTTYGIKNAGVIITDSHTTPLRLGVVGISLGHFGFQALKSYVGKKDIFGRTFTMERINIVDALATAAVLVMGEGSEQTPLARISELDFLDYGPVGDPPVIDPEYDIYNPLLQSDLWKSNQEDN
jgi:F420-0:gamma-glutamyl ligase